jgi:PilZ domain
MALTPRLLAQNEAVRSRKRLRLDVPVCLIIPRPYTVQLVDARVRDISEDGAAIFAGVELAVDSEIQMEFTPPGEGPLRVRAVVRNRRKYVYGIEFLPRNGQEELHLAALKAILLAAGTDAGGSVDDRRWEY